MGFVTNTSQPHMSAHIDILNCLIEIIEAGAPHCDGTKITSVREVLFLLPSSSPSITSSPRGEMIPFQDT